MEYGAILKKFFDRVYTEIEFVKRTYNALKKLGFTDENTIASVCICRDEISQSMRSIIKHIWGEAFNLSSLAGMFFAGKTGLLAAMHHAPNVGGKERYVFYAMPHIAIDAEGRLGVCRRAGREGESTACGALNTFQKEISLKVQRFKGSKVQNIEPLNLETVKPLNEIEEDDIEMSLIRMRLLQEIPSDRLPDLLELTKITQKAIQKDLEHALKAIIPPHPPLEKGGKGGFESDYAVFTGIQIHGPDSNYIWPASCYAVVNNTKYGLTV